MAWRAVDVAEQRVRFVVEASQGEKPMSMLCSADGISRPTGYLWLERYREDGLAGIAEHSRRSHRSPARTGSDLEQQIIRLRQSYPDWGARRACF